MKQKQNTLTETLTLSCWKKVEINQHNKHLINEANIQHKNRRRNIQEKENLERHVTKSFAK